ncbi:hypothetical protein F4802DRAFT_600410 [Xylaria palmicola]|nr:hypothetical protein F4802DRAFT_600410 [Xylaria palmicola]
MEISPYVALRRSLHNFLQWKRPEALKAESLADFRPSASALTGYDPSSLQYSLPVSPIFNVVDEFLLTVIKSSGDIMSAITETAFQRAILKFQRSLTSEQKAQFAVSSQDDVISEVQKIQDRYGSTRKLRSLSRLSKFLEAMSQLEQVVTVFLNVSNVVAFVWGPIKFALLVAGTRLETLECLLDTYIEIGEVIPSLRQYDQLFKAARPVLEVLERYFCDILEFHLNALEVFSSPAWKAFFNSAWKTFKTKFNPILESLKRHRTLLLDERLNTAVLEIQTSRSEILVALDGSTKQSVDNFSCVEARIRDIFTKLSEQLYGLQQSAKANEEHIRSSRTELGVIINKLDPPDFEGDQVSVMNICHSGSGQWIFENPGFSKWAQSKSIPDTVLFIHGIPGAGKTLIASTIINKLRADAGACHRTCLFFYFKHSSDTKRSMANMLRAFLTQLMHQDNTLIPEFHGKCHALSNAEARQLHNLKIWTVELLKSQNYCTIVLDGLDECYKDGNRESKKILEWFLLSVLPDCEREGATIRLLVLGQRDGDLDLFLLDFPSIRLDRESSHSKDLRLFTQKRASELGQRFGLDLEEEQDIVRRVTDTAKGMFIYARVVMDNLIAQGSAAELDEELQTKFPNGLDQAYERVVLRILDCPKRSEKQREAAAKILRWLTCAIRPLRWNEIQCLCCIDPHSGVCNPKHRRVDNCKTLCGSFVDVDDVDRRLNTSLQSNPVVSLVHSTARGYLIKTGRVNLIEENAHMAIWSSAYLASLPFSTETHGTDIRQIALSGYFGLEDYAVSSIQTHIIRSLEQMANLSSATAHHLQHVLSNLTKHLRLAVDSQIKLDYPENMRAYFKGNNHEGLTCRRLEHISTLIRDVTEDIKPEELDRRTKDIFLSLNGITQYRCRKLTCSMFSLDFENKKSRDLHINEHSNQFTCSAYGCLRRTIGFPSSSNLQKHEKEAHTTTVKQFDLFPSTKKPKDIWHACAEGDLEFVKDFHASGGDLHAAKTQRGRLRPIYIASRNGHSHICEFLGLNGCYAFDTSYRDTRFSALGEAIRMDNRDLFKTLINSATDKNIGKFINGADLCQHIVTAVRTGVHTFLDTLQSMRHKRREDFDVKHLLDMLCRIKAPYNPSTVDFIEETFGLLSPRDATELLTKRDGDGDNGLYWACVFQCESAVVFFLRHMDTQDIYSMVGGDNTPIYQTLDKCNLAIASRIVHHDPMNAMAVCDKKQNRPIHLACRMQHRVKFVELFLPYCIGHLNEANENGETPLHLAVRCRDSVVKVEMLLETGEVDLSKRNRAGQTVFDLETSPEIRELLRVYHEKQLLGDDKVRLAGQTVFDLETLPEMGQTVFDLETSPEMGQTDSTWRHY